MDVKNKLLSDQLIAIIRGISSEKIIPLAEALYAGGFRFMEITFDQSDNYGNINTLRCMDLLRSRYDGEICVGAGTVMTAEQVESAEEHGAQYIISPNVSKEVIEKTKESGLVSIPGAMTPTEIVNAYNSGADLVKVFPAGLMGPYYFKAVKAPISHIPLIAVGGVTPELIPDYKKAGAVGFGIGGKLTDREWIRDERFDLITAEAERYRKAADGE